MRLRFTVVCGPSSVVHSLFIIQNPTMKNNNYPYQLEKYKGPSTRYRCPGCGQQRRFTRYVYTESGQQVADHVGRCDRQDSCGYHLRPWEYLKQQGIPQATFSVRRPRQQPHQVVREAIAAEVVSAQRQVSYIPDQMANASFVNFRNNNFVQYLYTLGFERALVNRRILQYRIGTSERWPGASIWWQKDKAQRYRTGKVMLYDHTGHRVKEPHAHIAWVHSEMGEGYQLAQCLYGEHLLPWWDEAAQIAIVESEKTAVIASMYMPEYLWMATGGKDGLTPDRIAALRGREAVCYPDHGAYEVWQRRAQELGHIIQMSVSGVMEREGRSGEDVADWLLRVNGK